MLSAAVNFLEIFGQRIAIGGFHSFFAEKGEAEDAVQGSAEFVGDVRDKAAFCLIGRFGGDFGGQFGRQVGVFAMAAGAAAEDAGGFGADDFGHGVFFAAGWTPCVGPILGGIILLATDAATAWQGAALFVAYSLGLGIPFLLFGLAFDAMSGFLKRANQYLNIVSIISGIFLLVLGILIFTDSLTYLARFGSFLGSETL